MVSTGRSSTLATRCLAIRLAPPPQPSPTRGEGERRDAAGRNVLRTSERVRLPWTPDVAPDPKGCAGGAPNVPNGGGVPEGGARPPLHRGRGGFRKGGPAPPCMA